jgi:hypothetical protein
MNGIHPGMVKAPLVRVKKLQCFAKICLKNYYPSAVATSAKNL